jgi:hypothetical protein
VPSPFADILAALARAFEHASLRWYRFGAQAAIIHGAARLTADVDVTTLLDGAPPQALVSALLDAGFMLRVPDPEFVARTRVLPVIHVPSGVPADIVLACPGIEELFFARAKVLDVDGVRVPVACAEDIVVMKLLAGRPKDVDDVVAILAAHPDDLDLDLVRGTVRMLEEALDQSDLLPALDQALASARGVTRPSPVRPPQTATSNAKRKRSTAKRKR